MGHIISRDRLEVDPEKVEAVRDWPVPNSVTEIRSFLGLAGYYRKFVQDFSSIVVPLTPLTKKNVKFVWGPECQESFDRLNQALTSMPKELNMRHRRWIELVKDYGCDISYYPGKAEIKKFELAVYARGDAPNLSTPIVESTLRDRIRAVEASDEQL
ncbi:putative mitochondrial protein AtMg00860 [Primulina tabacum]|uniref:putative mitochondrial protein AtMg00860 n=1 Tax=Primulina tabacum TaxID=48773 RepID=UPI003F5A985E